MTAYYTDSILQSLDNELTFDYQKICNYIQRFLLRDDSQTLESIPTFIALAEQRLAVDLKFLPGVQVNQFQITQETPQDLPYTVIINKPAGWRQTKNLSILNSVNGRSYIYPSSYEYLQVYMADFTAEDIDNLDYTRDLEFYADYDNYNWIIGPYKRDQTYTLEVLYFSTIPPLSSTNQKNYWTELAPRALIYCALCESGSFLRSDNRTPIWEANYKECIGNLAKQNIDTFTDNSIQRTN